MQRNDFAPNHRRDFMKTLAKQTLGVSFAGSVSSSGLFGEAYEAAPSTGKAKHVVYLFMDGAMTHLDLFDPKGGCGRGG